MGGVMSGVADVWRYDRVKGVEIEGKSEPESE